MIPDKQQRMNQRGVSLVEVLVALLITAVIAVAVFNGLYGTVQGNQVARTSISAESLARSELEYVLSQAYDNTTWSYTLLSGASPTSPRPGWESHSLPDIYTGYSVMVSSSYPYTGKSTIQRITVAVKYNDSPIMDIETYHTQ